MGFGGGSKSSAPPASTSEPVGEVAVDNEPKPAGMQNRTEGSPIGRPLLTPKEAEPPKNLLG